MTSELVTPGDEHREELVGLMRVAFNLGSGALAERAAWLPVEKMRCVLEGDRTVAAAAARDFRQWFGGRELAMSGIWGVVTLPEHREAASRLAPLRRRGGSREGAAAEHPVPATQRPDRGMGYELAGTMTQHAVALDDLPRGPAGPLTVEEYDAARDLEALARATGRRCRRTMARSTLRIRIGGPRRSSGDGSATTCSGWWWRGASRASRDTRRSRSARIRVRSNSNTPSTAGTWWRRRWRVGRRCSRTCAGSEVSGDVEVTGPPAHPVALLVEEQRVRPWSFQWMLRLLDVVSALERRGYPPVSEEFVLAVEDGLFPENRGPWRVVADGGAVSVTPGWGRC